MSKLNKNQLSSRRRFLALGSASLATALTLRGRAAGASYKSPNPWSYDDSEFRKTDPRLIRFQETSRFSVVHESTRCVCLTGDERLLVGAGKFVTEYTLEGKRVGEFSVSQEVRCLAGSADNLVFVGTRDHVEVCSRSGERRAAWPSRGPKAYLTSIAVSTDDVFLADAGNRSIWRCDTEGSIKGKIGKRDSERKIPGFIVPSPFFDVEIAPDGLLRVTNPGRHCVEAYTFDGDLEFSWGKGGAAIENFCGCCNPINLALLRDGRVVTFEKGIPRVKIYNAQGTFESVVAGAEAFAENARVCGPNDCTLGGLDGVVDSNGRIFILDLVAANIRVMQPKPEEA